MAAQATKPRPQARLKRNVMVPELDWVATNRDVFEVRKVAPIKGTLLHILNVVLGDVEVFQLGESIEGTLLEARKAVIREVQFLHAIHAVKRHLLDVLDLLAVQVHALYVPRAVGEFALSAVAVKLVDFERGVARL